MNLFRHIDTQRVYSLRTFHMLRRRCKSFQATRCMASSRVGYVYRTVRINWASGRRRMHLPSKAAKTTCSRLAVPPLTPASRRLSTPVNRSLGSCRLTRTPSVTLDGSMTLFRQHMASQHLHHPDSSHLMVVMDTRRHSRFTVQAFRGRQAKALPRHSLPLNPRLHQVARLTWRPLIRWP